MVDPSSSSISLPSPHVIIAGLPPSVAAIAMNCGSGADLVDLGQRIRAAVITMSEKAGGAGSGLRPANTSFSSGPPAAAESASSCSEGAAVALSPEGGQMDERVDQTRASTLSPSGVPPAPAQVRGSSGGGAVQIVVPGVSVPSVRIA